MDGQDITPRDQLIGLVRRVLGEETPGPIGVEDRLSELGMSSIKMVDLLLAVEAEFDLTIPVTEITPENLTSIASIASLIGRLTR